MLRDLQPFCSPRSTDIHNRNNINHKPPFFVSQAADESHESKYRNKQRADSHVKTSAKNWKREGTEKKFGKIHRKVWMSRGSLE